MTKQNSPIATAIALHNSLGWTKPTDFTLDEIALSLGIIIKQVPIVGSEGRILMKRDTGIISVNNGITHSGKRNFVIAHEIGHFLLHRSMNSLFSDTQKTLSDWHINGPHEKQANEFASELLMPTDLYKARVKSRKLNLSLIEEVSAYFGVSLTAAFIRYVSLGEFPLMVVYMEDGVIKWKHCSTDFPFQFLRLNSPVPTWTVAGDFFNKGAIEPKPELVDAIEWFAEDFQIKYRKDWKLWEQCYPVSNRGLISCIWTY